MNSKNIEQIIVCPNCESQEMNFKAKSFICEKCKSSFDIKAGKYILQHENISAITDGLDSLKKKFKDLTWFYNFLIFLISPVKYYSPTFIDKSLKRFVQSIENDDNDNIAINLGSGNTVLSKKIINVDMFEYSNVDVVCSIDKLPFKDNSVDNIINVAVLEHVPNPEQIVAEMHRVLKPGGTVYSYFPFIQGFHASPFDFSRRTKEGIKYLYKDFELKLVKNTGGPTSGMLWILQEWLAIVFSFGIRPLHKFLYLLFMVLTFPLKFLDIFLEHLEVSENISTGFTIICKKMVL